jgi:hypothetical protein
MDGHLAFVGHRPISRTVNPALPYGVVLDLLRAARHDRLSVEFIDDHRRRRFGIISAIVGHVAGRQPQCLDGRRRRDGDSDLAGVGGMGLLADRQLGIDV